MAMFTVFFSRILEISSCKRGSVYLSLNVPLMTGQSVNVPTHCNVLKSPTGGQASIRVREVLFPLPT